MLFLLALCWPCTQVLNAHESIGSVSNVIISAQGRLAQYYLNIPPILRKLVDQMGYADEKALQEYFSWTLKMATWDKPCTLRRVRAVVPQASGNSIIHLEFICPDDITDLTITSTMFLDMDEKHVQFIRLVAPDNPRTVLQEDMLTGRHTVFHVADVNTGGSVLLYRAYRFLLLGIEHILFGYDHVLFILSVILVASRFMEVFKLVASFTVAHSITLTLAFLDVVSLRSAIVEPLIALTIAVVAFENVFFREFKRRWILVFIFGLIHGLGFVGVLKEITVSKQELLTSLFSFNVGIEVGQLIIVGAGAYIMYFVRKTTREAFFIRWVSVVIGVLGLLWFAERVSDVVMERFV